MRTGKELREMKAILDSLLTDTNSFNLVKNNGRNTKKKKKSHFVIRVFYISSADLGRVTVVLHVITHIRKLNQAV